MKRDTGSRCGYVAVIGKPNTGKSTIMNCLLGINLSVVNRKVQTTRNKILGILSKDNYQVIFLDTPGILEPKYELQRFMITEITSSLKEADIILHTMDATTIDKKKLAETEKKYEKLFKGKIRINVINKMDLISKEKILSIIGDLKTSFNYENIVPVSALKAINIDELEKVIVENLPESPFLYDRETVTDKPEKFFVSEIIRQKILDMFHEEIPYSVFVHIRKFTERENSKDYINAEIILERESQKVILIGRKGEKIKKLGSLSRKGIEEFLGREVYLELFVKVRKDWRKDKRFIKDNLS
ncbi:MAG: GTPase Era [Bacteroidetes bacterium]|nr:GTPase Era [Bacteroidota bacterium]